MVEQSKNSHRSSFVKKLLFKPSSYGECSGVSFSVLALSGLVANCTCNEACQPACLGQLVRGTEQLWRTPALELGYLPVTLGSISVSSFDLGQARSQGIFLLVSRIGIKILG